MSDILLEIQYVNDIGQSTTQCTTDLFVFWIVVLHVHISTKHDFTEALYSRYYAFDFDYLSKTFIFAIMMIMTYTATLRYAIVFVNRVKHSFKLHVLQKPCLRLVAKFSLLHYCSVPISLSPLLSPPPWKTYSVYVLCHFTEYVPII